MKRREFITFVGSAATWPLVARTQQSSGMRRIGVLLGNAESDPQSQAGLAKFTKALQDLGWRSSHISARSSMGLLEWGMLMEVISSWNIAFRMRSLSFSRVWLPNMSR